MKLKKLDLNSPVETRDGRPARIIASGGNYGGGCGIVAAITGECGRTDILVTCNEYGRQCSIEYKGDIVNPPQIITETRYYYRNRHTKIVRHRRNKSTHSVYIGNNTYLGSYTIEVNLEELDP